MKGEVHIVGAGPAGLAAAIAVERAGGHAVVSEKHAGVGQRFHGDFQGLENWTTAGDVLGDLGALGIEPVFEHIPFREFVVYDPEGRSHTYRSPEPIWYLVRRGDQPGTLDRSLAEQATHAGAEIRFRTNLLHLPEGGIVAHGPHRPDAIAAGYVFEADHPDGAWAAVSRDVAPGGYAYLLICGGRGTVATCLFADFHRERQYVERTVELFEKAVGLEMRDPHRFGGFGNVVPSASVRKGKLLYAGEAAGFQDALFGFGMRHAIVSGHLAARAVIEGGDGAGYERLADERLGAILRRSLVNRYAYDKLGNRGFSALLRWIDRSPDVRRWLHRHYSREILRPILYPLAQRQLARRPALVTECPEGCDCTWCRCRRHDAETPASCHR